MLQNEVELVQTQAQAMDISVSINHYDVNRYSVTIGAYVYSDCHKAVSALTTLWLKQHKGL